MSLPRHHVPIGDGGHEAEALGEHLVAVPPLGVVVGEAPALEGGVGALREAEVEAAVHLALLRQGPLLLL